MFGLEKGKDQPKRFEFDLEKELKESDKKKKELLAQIDKQTGQLKGTLRSGTDSEKFDEYGALLQAYSALKRVVKRTARE